MNSIIPKAQINAMISSNMHTLEQVTQIINNKNLDIQVFTRIDKDTDQYLEKLAEKQDRSKSYIIRKAIEKYISTAL